MKNKLTIQYIKDQFVDFRKVKLENTTPSREKIEEAQRRLILVEDFIDFLSENLK